MELAVLLFKYGRQTWGYCILETDASVQVYGFGTVAEEQTIGRPLSRNPFSNAIGDLKISCFLSPRVSWAGSECRLCW